MRSSLPLPQLITSIFSSLSQTNRRWTLTRTLSSDNPQDIHGQLHGSATFSPLSSTDIKTTTPSSDHRPTVDILYHEEGEMPRQLGMGMGMRFTKKYIWRLSENGRISVWFAKVGREDEPDYLFHEFDFHNTGDEKELSDSQVDKATFVAPPIPPEWAMRLDPHAAVVVTARGNHLCINDMYRTAYAFLVRPESGEVLSWVSRHVVKGPKKNQDIVNLYRMEA
ncbi:hypothetical protein FE257_001382 [Aspergillus nanangensis]|uniref:DUF6314 domain-containing protein n=1 Tax=Aspergillus nanangensis TaxID=2582783 RepID=A0AAD4CDS7_ASPNN|nr:hypothetical protein FE257_001382 [Aspergillus nanangensis]